MKYADLFKPIGGHYARHRTGQLCPTCGDQWMREEQERTARLERVITDAYRRFYQHHGYNETNTYVSQAN